MDEAGFREAVRILSAVLSPPNRREQPVEGDLPEKHYAFWFDGGAATMNTGGGTTYTFTDGASAWQPYPWESGYPNVHIKLKSGEEVRLTFG
jgi:hypothetical protein